MRLKKCRHDYHIYSWKIEVEDRGYGKNEKHNAKADIYICLKCGDKAYVETLPQY